MVTIKNDIESSAVFIPTSQQQQQVKDVNLKQQGGSGQQPRRRSYRCVTIVSVVVLLLLAIGVGSVLYFGPALNRTPAEANTGSPSSTPRTVAVVDGPAPSQPPTFSEPEISGVSSTDDDDDEMIDIDEPATSSSTSTSSTTSTTTSTTTTTTFSPLFFDGGSGGDDNDSIDLDDSEEYAPGSGSGAGELRDS